MSFMVLSTDRTPSRQIGALFRMSVEEEQRIKAAGAFPPAAGVRDRPTRPAATCTGSVRTT